MTEVKIGVIGTGSIGELHIDTLGSIPGCSVVALNDIAKENARRIAAERDARFMEDSGALIASPDVDAVLVASWDPTHEEYVIRSIRAGKYVFCEKPLADTPSGCMRVMEAEMAAGQRLLQVGFMRRYDSCYRMLRDALTAHTVGNPLLLHSRHRVVRPTGVGHTSETLITRALSHEFDITRWLLRDEFVSAQILRPRPSRHAGEGVCDPQVAILRTRNGIYVDAEISMNARYGYEVACEVVGEEGTISLPSPASPLLRRNGMAGHPVCQGWKERFADAYAAELREWVQSMLAGKIIGPSAWDGYVSSMVADVCVRAGDTGRILPVSVPDCPSFYLE